MCSTWQCSRWVYSLFRLCAVPCCVVHCVIRRRQTTESQDQSDFYRTNKSTLVHKSLCKWSADPAKSTPNKCTEHTHKPQHIGVLPIRDFYSRDWNHFYTALFFNHFCWTRQQYNYVNDDVAKFADVIVSYCPYKLHYSAVAQAALWKVHCQRRLFVFLARVNYVCFASVDAFVVVFVVFCVRQRFRLASRKLNTT